MNELDLFGETEPTSAPEPVAAPPAKPAAKPKPTAKAAQTAKKQPAAAQAKPLEVEERELKVESTAEVETAEMPALMAEAEPDVITTAQAAAVANVTADEIVAEIEAATDAMDAPQESVPATPKGSVCLVTGSSRGIGRGIALELAKLGHTIVVNYAGNAQAADECLQLVRDAGGDGITVQGDISNSGDRERLVQTVLDTYGRIDVLVNNAGVAPNVRADILDAGEESFDRLIDINLKGPYFLTQTVARHMIKQVEADPDATRPQIVTITSVSVYTASTNRGDYCISKAGLGMMTALWAARLAEWGIGVYEIRPGVIATDMTGGVKEKYDALIADGAWPIKRWGEPSDVGRAVSAIVRGDFPFSTGEVFNVDGGFHLRTL